MSTTSVQRGPQVTDIEDSPAGINNFVIVAANNSEKNLYIQSATLNGKPLSKPWFSHADIQNGGKLVFQMGPAPNKNWGSSPDAAPPSMSGSM